MRWYDTLTGRAFRNWLISLTTKSHIPAGAPLDPFTTSNRNLRRCSAWLTDLEQGSGLGTGRRADQAAIDLERAQLVSRQDDGSSTLTALGGNVLDRWRALGIDNDDFAFETARAFVLLREADLVRSSYYFRIRSFWTQVIQVFPPTIVFTNPHLVSLIGALNQDLGGFNPWRALVGGTTAPFSSSDIDDWATSANALSDPHDPDFENALNKFKTRVDEWENRSEGRIAFCKALAVFESPAGEQRDVLHLIDIDPSSISIIESLISSTVDLDAHSQAVWDLLIDRHNVVLYGPPGTGKTRSAFGVQDKWEATNGPGSVFNVTFHPSYGYEEFVVGYRPNPDDPSTFRLTSGPFVLACQAARDAQDDNPDDPAEILLVIDEINRGDTARIFGELITYIESDKRERPFYYAPDATKQMSIPSNLRLLGTMNTADRSISLIDVALRRRFIFFEMPPDPDVFTSPYLASHVEGINLGHLLTALNQRLTSEHVDTDRQLGHALLAMSPESASLEQLRYRFKFQIYPLVTEYCFDDRAAARRILGDLVTEEARWANLPDESLKVVLNDMTNEMHGS